jgi:hypothetical protein
MNALLKALDSRGYTVGINDDYKDSTYTTILGETISFGIIETSSRILKPISDRKRKHYLFYNPWDYVPSGKLTLRIKEYYGKQKNISDGEVQKLENCLNRSIIILIRAAEAKKVAREEREQWAREWREKQQKLEKERLLKEEEERKVKKLFDDAILWNNCNLVRKYIRAIQEEAIKKFGKIEQGSELDSWIIWANQQIARFDTVVNTVRETKVRK